MHGSLLPSILTDQATTPVSDVQLHGSQTPLTAIAAAGDFATAATTLAVSTPTPSVSVDSNGEDRSSVNDTLASGDQASAEAPEGQNNDIVSKLIARFDIPADCNYTTDQLLDLIEISMEKSRGQAMRRELVNLDSSKQEQYDTYCSIRGRIAFGVSIGTLSLIIFGSAIWMSYSYRKKRALAGEMIYDWEGINNQLAQARHANAALAGFQEGELAEFQLELESSHLENQKMKEENGKNKEELADLKRMIDQYVNIIENLTKHLPDRPAEGVDDRKDE
ncbi:hypothetical protein FFLO_02731 [Filobasidium floriforme]|uniref:Uncharacterized protein n=1 Tax=Filobasidium floriforme TaxID=5210 RepID=A0A8K0NRJ0_9TREE|nr:hypothetical protein FFLO_02731 [Filobasidium floriforme]